MEGYRQSVDNLPTDASTVYVQVLWSAMGQQWQSDVHEIVSLKSEITIETPEPISPLAGAEVPENPPLVLSYRAVSGAEHYQVQRYDRTIPKWSYSNSRVLPEVCNEGLCEVEAPGVPAQERALWRVRAYGNGQWSEWSAMIVFNVIEASQELAVPETLSPATGDELPENQPIVLSYRAVSGAEHYQVQRYDRTIPKWSYSNSRVLPEVCNEGLCEVEAPGVPAQERALWRVRAYGNGQWSEWSAMIAFNVIEL